MVDLRTTDGDTLVEDLTRAEMDRLREYGVLDDPDADGSGDGDSSGDSNPNDSPDTDGPDGGSGEEPDADTDPDASDDSSGAGDGADGDDADDPTDAPDTTGDAEQGDDGASDETPEMDGDHTPDGDDADGSDADGGDPDDAPGDAPEMDAGDMTDGDGPDAPDIDDLADELDDLGDDGWDDPADDAGSNDTPDDDGPEQDAGDGGDDASSDDGGDPSDSGSSDLGGEQGSDGDSPDDTADTDPGTDGDGADGADGDPTDGDGGDPSDDGDAGDETGGSSTTDGTGGGSHDPGNQQGKGDPTADGSDNAGDYDPDDIQDAIDDLKDKSDARDASEWSGAAGVDDDDEIWKDRLKRVRATSDLREARDARDRRLETDSPSGYSDPHVPSQHIRQWMEQAGLAREIRDRFEEIKNAPEPVNARRGSRLDRKRLTRFRMGDPQANDFYLRKQGHAEKARRAIGVALDLSGSMETGVDGQRVTEAEKKDTTLRIDVAKVAVAGMAIACEEIGDTFTASGFQDVRNPAPLITGPHEPFEWDHLDSVSANNRTPMGTGIIKSARRLMEANQPDKTLFVVCDGKPSYPENLGDQDGLVDARARENYKHARRCVEEVRNAGIGVVGVGIGDVEDHEMEEVFGTDDDGNPNYITTEAGNLPAKLAEAYERQLDTV